MSQTIMEPEPGRRRVRELTAAHQRAWNERARFLRESTGLLPPPHEELIQKVRAPALALLAEGVPEQQWVAASWKLCVLIERYGDELVVRVAPRKVIQTAPEEATPAEVESRAFSTRYGRYRRTLVRISRYSKMVSMVAVGLFVTGTVAGLATGSQGVTQAAVWCAIAAVFAFIVHILARVTVSEPTGEELDEEHGESFEQAASGERSGEAADVVPLYHTGADWRDPAGGGAYTSTAPVRVRADTDSSDFAYEELGEYERSGQRLGPASVYENLDMSQREFLGYELQALPEGDLLEGFAHARALPDNDAQGSDAIRVVEARGELASTLGVEYGEAVVEIAWATSGGGRRGHSYLPYREVVCGTSLDPRRRPSERIRPACRHSLHELLIEEKGLGALYPKVTYRIGPDSYQFFGCPMWSSGEHGGYVLEDKLKYLMERASELGFENDYDAGEWRRMQEIAATRGEEEPTHQQLLRFALIAGMDPRFLFEDSGEDLRDRTRTGSDPGQPVLWRVEAAMSEAHGLPVEIFERSLMDWYVSEHSWRFR